MEFNDVIRQRFSCRKFSEKQVEKEKLNAILEAGRLAPTAKNFQEQHVYVIQSEEMIKKIDMATRCRYGAPTVLVVTFNINHVFVYPDKSKNSGAEDAAIVATHMILAATNEGINSCWINILDEKKLREVLNLPEEEEVLMIMDLGYKNEGIGPCRLHEDRKPLDETVSYM